METVQQTQLNQSFYKMIAPKLISPRGEGFFAKEIVALQMFTIPKYNEKLHIMLVGPAASGKTILIYDIANIVPNSSYSSSNLTRVGLLEKLVACNNGIFAIDEFDKLSKHVRTGLLEAMQTGTITIDKYQTHRQYDARCNILVACNPKGDVFMHGMPLLSQLKFSLVLMSRFHLVIPFYAVEGNMYPDIAMRMNLPMDDDKRRLKLMENLVRVKTECPVVDVPDGISKKIGHFIAMLKEMSDLREMISPRLIEGSLSMLKARARMDLCSEVKMKHYKYVYDILERIYLKERY